MNLPWQPTTYKCWKCDGGYGKFNIMQFLRIAQPRPEYELWNVPRNRWFRCVYCQFTCKESLLLTYAMPEGF